MRKDLEGVTNDGAQWKVSQVDKYKEAQKKISIMNISDVDESDIELPPKGTTMLSTHVEGININTIFSLKNQKKTKTIVKNLMMKKMLAENLRMKSMIKHKEGFTLFELLIALFIGTILIMSGAYAIRTGLFSMEREEAWFNDS